MNLRTRTGVISTEAFLRDPHAAKYRDVVENHSDAFARLVAILNDPLHQQQLLAAERFGHPALSGVVRVVEDDELIAQSLASPTSARFRQAAGVAVRLTMEGLGWATTGRKGPVRGARHFKSSERYAPPLVPEPTPSARARSALEAIAFIGDEPEREQTAKDLLGALAESRRAEHRPF